MPHNGPSSDEKHQVFIFLPAIEEESHGKTRQGVNAIREQSMSQQGPLRWLSGKKSACQCTRPKRLRFNSWVGKIPWRRKWQPAPVFFLENPVDRGAWWAIVHGVAKDRHDLETKQQQKSREITSLQDAARELRPLLCSNRYLSEMEPL